MEKIKDLANKHFGKTVAVSDELHQHPERSGQEQYADSVCSMPDELDIE
ncbi:MAG: hypothetical protein J5730_06330 [Bacteroidales bacterium]|nr:hypothetical protein [Bacteroidales bacterium]